MPYLNKYGMGRFQLNTIIFLLAVAAVMLWLTTEKENVKLQKQKEALILKSDSLHMLQLKTKKDLIYSNNKIDSLHLHLSYKKRKR